MSQPDEPDLSLVSTEDLVGELFSRVDHAVVSFLQIVAEQDGRGELRLVRRWKGNGLTCVGLASAVSGIILKDWDDRALPGQIHGF